MKRPVQPHPDIHPGLAHAVIVIQLHRAPLVLAILGPVVGVGPRLTRLEEETAAGSLAIIYRSRMGSRGDARSSRQRGAGRLLVKVMRVVCPVGRESSGRDTSLR